MLPAVRPPFGKLNGGLAAYPATELGAIAIRAGLERVGLEGTEVDYVIMGQVLQAGAGQAPARQAAVGAGLPIEVPADTINKVCASSIRAVQIADSMIRAGDVEVVVTGGMEAMSNAPYALPRARFGYRMGDGASCVLVCSEEFAERRGLEPLATVVAQGYVADEFAWLARTPANAGAQALEKAGKSIGDVKRVEVNEAFSSVALTSVKMLGVDPDVD